MTNVEGRVIKLEVLWGRLKEGLRKLGERLDLVEQQQRQVQGMGYGWGGGGGGIGIARAVVTTAIPTGTISTPSLTGRVTIHRWDAGTDTDSAGSTGVQVNNDFTLSASIGVGKVVKIAWIDAAYWLVSAEC